MDSIVPRFLTALQTLWRGVESEIVRKMESQITGPQLYMLFYISRAEKCKLTELAEKMDVKPSAVTVMIDRLERAGFVKRAHDKVDRRSISVELTEVGQEVLEKAKGIRRETISSYLSKLKPEEVPLVTEILEKMVFVEKQNKE